MEIFKKSRIKKKYHVINSKNSFRGLESERFILLFFHGVKHISQTTFSTILTIKMGSHEDTSSAFFSRTFTSQSVNFAIVVDSVIFQLSKFDILMLVFDFLGGSVILLLTFLSATSETEYQVKS